MKIRMNTFARRQLPQSPYSHFVGEAAWPGVRTDKPWEGEDEFLALVEEHFPNAREGYRTGVLLVTVPADQFRAGIIPVTPQTKLHAVCSARQEGEQPTISFRAEGKKVQAKSCTIVLYSHDTLGEDASTDADWEVVSINASSLEEEEPMSPVTMARNFLGLEGGTQTSYTAEEFAKAVMFHATHAQVTG